MDIGSAGGQAGSAGSPGIPSAGSPGIRAARAGIFTALCVTLSAGGHVLLSGAPVPAATLAAVAVGVFLIAFAFAPRECGYGRIAGVLVPLELLADAVFTTGQHACYGQGGGPVTGPLRAVGLDLLCGGGSLGTPLARVAAQNGSAAPETLPWLLLACHVGVGLLAAAWLRRGEDALARLLRAAAATAFRPFRPELAPVPAPAPLQVRAARTARAARLPRAVPLLTHSVHRRGPPRCLLAA